MRREENIPEFQVYEETRSTQVNAMSRAKKFIAEPANSLISGLDNIHKFGFVVRFQNVNFLNREFTNKFLSKGLDHLNSVLANSGVHGHNELSAKSSENDEGVTFDFSHDRYGWQVQLLSDKFIISRRSSSLENFLAWYYLLMPHAASLFMAFSDEVFNISEKKLTVTMSGFEYRFLLCNFEHGKQKKRNIDILSKMLKDIPPTSDGKPEGDNFNNIYRVNLHVSKLETVAGQLRNCWYRLEAPLNESGQYLIADFEIRGADLELFDDTGKVTHTQGYNLDALQDYSLALEVFLKKHAIDTFLRSVTSGWNFSTSREL